jgi:hypothetical protein
MAVFMIITLNSLLDSKDTLYTLIFIGVLIFTLALSACKDCANGMSIGRWITGIAVRDIDDPGIMPNKKRLIVRNLLKMLMPWEIFGLLVNKEALRYGEKKTNTHVVVIKRASLIKQFVVILLSLVAFFLITFLGIMQTFKHSDAYLAAIKYIEQNKEVQAMTDGIKGYGWLTQGSLEESSNSKKASFIIEVQGNKRNVLVDIKLSDNLKSGWIVNKFSYKEK